MADTITPKRRSEIMSHIRSKDTKIELMVRRYLFALGYRYRVNYKALPGKPDIVFTKKKIAIFIHGCYWHGHNCGSRYAHASQSNKAYWGPKIQRTQQRDQEHIAQLEVDGWKVIVLWECQIKNDFDQIIETLVNSINNNTP
jgi:DNA mismatch endonuclease (patch repair protein)